MTRVQLIRGKFVNALAARWVRTCLELYSVIARHARSFGKGEQIEDAAHIQALVEQKRAARRYRAANLVFHAAPASETLLTCAAGRSGNLRAIAASLTRLLQRYGAAELRAAIVEALERDVPHPNAVRFALERRRQERHQPPPIAVDLPPHVQARDLPVRPAPKGACSELKTGDAEASLGRLELYDGLKRATDE